MYSSIKHLTKCYPSEVTDSRTNLSKFNDVIRCPLINGYSHMCLCKQDIIQRGNFEFAANTVDLSFMELLNCFYLIIICHISLWQREDRTTIVSFVDLLMKVGTIKRPGVKI